MAAPTLPKDLAVGFLGVDLRRDRLNLEDHAVLESIDLDLHRQLGVLRPRQGRTLVSGSGVGGPIRTMDTFQGVRYQVAGTTLYRDFAGIVFGLSSAYPITTLAPYRPLLDNVTYVFIADIGPSGMPLKYNPSGAGTVTQWGSPAPTTPPTLVSQGTATGIGTDLTGAYSVRYTYVRMAGGQIAYETNPSAQSNTISDDAARLDATVYGSSDTQITHVALYRTLAGGTRYYYDQMIANPGGGVAAVITTIQPDGSLGDEVEYDNQTPPHAWWVVEFQGSLFLLGSPDYPEYLWYSKRFRPESYPPDQYIKIGDPSDPLLSAVSLTGVLGVFTGLTKYRVIGNTVSGFTALEALNTRGIVSPQAVLSSSHGAMFVAYDGIFLTNFVDQDAEISTALQGLFEGHAINGYYPIDWSQKAAISLGEYKRRLYFGYVDTAGTRMLAVYSQETQHWYHYAHPVNRLEYEEINDALLMGSSDGFVWQLETGETDGGTVVNGRAALAPRPEGDPFTRKAYAYLGVDCQGAWNVTPYVDDAGLTTYTFGSTGSARRWRYVALPGNTTGHHWRIDALSTDGTAAAFYAAEMVHEDPFPGTVLVHDQVDTGLYAQLIPGQQTAYPLPRRRFDWVSILAETVGASEGGWSIVVNVDGVDSGTVALSGAQVRLWRQLDVGLTGFEWYTRLAYTGGNTPMVYGVDILDTGPFPGLVVVELVGTPQVAWQLLPGPQVQLPLTRRRFDFVVLEADADPTSAGNWDVDVIIDDLLTVTVTIPGGAIPGPHATYFARLPRDVVSNKQLYGYHWETHLRYSAGSPPRVSRVEVIDAGHAPGLVIVRDPYNTGVALQLLPGRVQHPPVERRRFDFLMLDSESLWSGATNCTVDLYIDEVLAHSATIPQNVGAGPFPRRYYTLPRGLYGTEWYFIVYAGTAPTPFINNLEMLDVGDRHGMVLVEAPGGTSAAPSALLLDIVPPRQPLPRLPRHRCDFITLIADAVPLGGTWTLDLYLDDVLVNSLTFPGATSTSVHSTYFRRLQAELVGNEWYVRLRYAGNGSPPALTPRVYGVELIDTGANPGLVAVESASNPGLVLQLLPGAQAQLPLQRRRFDFLALRADSFVAGPASWVIDLYVDDVLAHSSTVEAMTGTGEHPTVYHALPSGIYGFQWYFRMHYSISPPGPQPLVHSLQALDVGDWHGMVLVQRPGSTTEYVQLLQPQQPLPRLPRHRCDFITLVTDSIPNGGVWTLNLYLDDVLVNSLTFPGGAIPGPHSIYFRRLQAELVGSDWYVVLSWAGSGAPAAPVPRVYGVDLIDTGANPGLVVVETAANSGLALQLLPGQPAQLPLLRRRFDFLAVHGDNFALGGTWHLDLHVDDVVAASVDLAAPAGAVAHPEYFTELPRALYGNKHYITMHYTPPSPGPTPLVHGVVALDVGDRNGLVLVEAPGSPSLLLQLLPQQQTVVPRKRFDFVLLVIDATTANPGTWTVDLYVDEVLKAEVNIPALSTAGTQTTYLRRLPPEITGTTWYARVRFAGGDTPRVIGLEVLDTGATTGLVVVEPAGNAYLALQVLPGHELQPPFPRRRFDCIAMDVDPIYNGPASWQTDLYVDDVLVASQAIPAPTGSGPHDKTYYELPKGLYGYEYYIRMHYTGTEHPKVQSLEVMDLGRWTDLAIVEAPTDTRQWLQVLPAKNPPAPSDKRNFDFLVITADASPVAGGLWMVDLYVDDVLVLSRTVAGATIPGPHSTIFVELPAGLQGYEWYTRLRYQGGPTPRVYSVDIVDVGHAPGLGIVENGTPGQAGQIIPPPGPAACPLPRRRFDFLVIDADASDSDQQSGIWSVDLYVDDRLRASVQALHAHNKYLHKLPPEIYGFEWYTRVRYNGTPVPQVHCINVLDTGPPDGQVWITANGVGPDTYITVVPAMGPTTPTIRKRYMYLKADGEAAYGGTWTVEVYLDGTWRFSCQLPGDRNRHLVRLPPNMLAYTWHVRATYSLADVPLVLSAELLTQDLGVT